MEWGHKQAWTTQTVQLFSGFGQTTEDKQEAVKSAQQKTGSQGDHEITETIEFLPLSRKFKCRHSSATAL